MHDWVLYLYVCSCDDDEQKKNLENMPSENGKFWFQIQMNMNFVPANEAYNFESNFHISQAIVRKLNFD